MPVYYSIIPTNDVTTSVTANITTPHLRLLTVGNQAWVSKLDLVGKGAGQVNITGIEIDLIRYGTASTSGSAITPNPRVPTSVAATTTAFTGPTVGTTAKYQWAGGMMSSGQGGFVPLDPNDDAIELYSGGGANGNLDLDSQSEGTAGLNLKYTLGMFER